MATDQPHDLLVFSDLKQGGYIMEDRFERLSLEHARLTLSKLAKFHASGLLYKERVRYDSHSSGAAAAAINNIIVAADY